MQYWLLKTEPEEYSWQSMLKDNIATWDGVKNAQAQNNMKQMKIGDLAFFYHTGKLREIVGIVKVCKEFYLPSDGSPGLVDVQCVSSLSRIVKLSEIKTERELVSMQTLKQPRLSVSKVSAQEWFFIKKMASK